MLNTLTCLQCVARRCLTFCVPKLNTLELEGWLIPPPVSMTITLALGRGPFGNTDNPGNNLDFMQCRTRLLTAGSWVQMKHLFLEANHKGN